MNYTLITELLLLILPLLIVVYDVFAALKVREKSRRNGTISAVIRRESLKRWSFVAAAWSTLTGHFFGPFEWRTPVILTVLLAIWGVGLLIANVFRRMRVKTYVGLFLWACLHVGLGAALWSQGDSVEQDEQAKTEDARK